MTWALVELARRPSADCQFPMRRRQRCRRPEKITRALLGTQWEPKAVVLEKSHSALMSHGEEILP